MEKDYLNFYIKYIKIKVKKIRGVGLLTKSTDL